MVNGCVCWPGCFDLGFDEGICVATAKVFVLRLFKRGAARCQTRAVPHGTTSSYLSFNVNFEEVMLSFSEILRSNGK